MHYCPRSSCRRSYHAECLRKANSVDPEHMNHSKLNSGPSPRSLEMQCFISHDENKEKPKNDDSKKDDIEEELEKEDIKEDLKDELKEDKMEVDLKDSFESIISWSSANTTSLDPLKNFPGDLLALARSPMVKGIDAVLPREWSCVTGNVAAVFRARHFVKETTMNRKLLPDNWRMKFGIPGTWRGSLLDWVVEDQGFLCPECKGPI